MYCIILAFLYLTIPLVGLPTAQDTPWKLKVDKNGIQVYTRKVEGYPVKEFKGITVIDAEPLEIVEVLMDVPGYTEWIYKCQSSKLLGHPKPDEYLFHIGINVPFPVKDRDIVQRMNIRARGDHSIFFEIVSIPEYIPEQEGFVRMPVSDGGWTLIPVENGGTLVTMQFLSDPGGSIPDWVVNMMLNDNPYHTLRNLKNLLSN